ncbi:hypothetical protein [Paenibacillus sp. 481]|uniref:hypothetical protein n=1 Tax=Paenibacillus sp. 481 TaxID=2835869 RepID=UPI001E2A7A18|nr:hypothetical protein [Paenibacillus sp. 481]UHA74880.1 hypothetical protein KIK04_07505 [Paenibacillus sp. 481]
MYWWSTKKLIADFRAGQVSEKQKLKYLITFALLHAISAEVLLWLNSEEGVIYNIYDWITVLTHILLIGWGISACYKANVAGDGKHFIERFICLSVPITIRYITIIIPILFLILIGLIVVVGGFTLELFEDIWWIEEWLYNEGISIITVVLIAVMLLAYYWEIRKAIQATAQPSTTATLPE